VRHDEHISEPQEEGMVRREESRHDFAFIAGVIVGAISGALVTLALTPMSGEQAREKVMERAGNLEPVKERATELATSAQHLVETGREKAADLVAKSPLPFGEHAETEGEAVAATVSGGVVHTQNPVDVSADTGLAGTGARAETPVRPASEQG
jgi:gas vesicle protein